MLNMMIVGAVQEPTKFEKKLFLPSVELFDENAWNTGYFSKLKTWLDDSVSLEDLRKNTAALGQDPSVVFQSPSELSLLMPKMDQIVEAMKEADYDMAIAVVKEHDEQGDTALIKDLAPKVYFTLAYHVINGTSPEMIEKCHDFILAMTVTIEFDGLNSKIFDEEYPTPSNIEPSQYSRYYGFFKAFWFKAQPDLGFDLPKLSKPQYPGKAPPVVGQPSNPEDPNVAIRERIASLQLALTEVQRVISYARSEFRRKTIQKEDFIKQALRQKGSPKMRKFAFGDQFGSGNSPVGIPAASGADEGGQEPSKEDLENDFTEYEASNAARVFNKESFALIEGSSKKLLLSEFGDRVQKFEYVFVVEQLRSKISNLKLRAKLPRAVSKSIFFGGHVVEIDTKVFEEISCEPPESICHCELLKNLDAKHAGKPFIHLLGTGAHYRIETTFEEYIKGELVHTEPVLAGTTKTMSFRKLDRRDEFEESFTSSETEEEKENSSTDRFSMESEVERESQKERELEVNAKASSKYGPVKYEASAGYKSSSANQDKSRMAKEILQEKMNRALSRIKSKTELRKSVRMVTETERNSGFELDNSGKPSFTGFYHAIDKKYTSQLMCNGKHLIVRICMQQPMAFLLHCMSTNKNEGVQLEKPIAPNEFVNELILGPDGKGKILTSPEDITPENYDLWAAAFGVTDFPAPPSHKSATTQYKNGNETGEQWPTTGGMIGLPDGCRAVEARASVLMSSWIAYTDDDGDHYGYASIAVGSRREKSRGSNGELLFPLDGETDEIPWSLRGPTNTNFALNIVVYCEPLPEKMDEWRMQVFGAIWDDYRRKQSDYENAIQAAKIEAGIEIQGRNPRINEQIVQTECMKIAIGATFPWMYYRGFNSMKFSNCPEEGMPRPEPDFADAYEEGPWVTFISQLYEYENMTYQFLPYFFGNRKDWCKLRKIVDVDPKFEAALNAGYVIIDLPITLGFENAFFHYLQTGDIWEGTNRMPVVGDLLYKAIALEIRDAQVKDGVPCDDPWEVIEPTSLVMVTDDVPKGL